MLAVLQRLTKTLIVCLTLSVLSGCADVVIGLECSWVKEIRLAPQDVVAEATEKKIVAHNKKVHDLCRDN